MLGRWRGFDPLSGWVGASHREARWRVISGWAYVGGGSNVRFSRGDRRFRHITGARDHRDVPRNAAEFVRRSHPCPRPRRAALPEKRSRVRSARALSVGDEDLFRIDCPALLFQPVSEGVVLCKTSRGVNRCLSNSECGESGSQMQRFESRREPESLGEFRF
jgi:hypothetical protein